MAKKEIIEQKDELPRCRRCGRKLTNPKHRQIGYGPACYRKIKEANKKKIHKLF